MTVYVLSHHGDVHAHAVQWACESLGERAILLNLYELFENTRIGLIPESGRQRIVLNGENIESDSKVWLRRPNTPKLLDDNSVHVSDLRFAESCCSSLYRGFLESLSECRLVVSAWGAHAAASLKMNQIKVAQTVGMNTPKTLFTNDIGLALSQIEDGWIAKSHNHFKWAEHSGGRSMMPSVIPVTHAMLEQYSKSFPYSPIILQKKINSIEEVRVFVFGNTIFAASLGFSNLGGELDWRRFHRHLDIKLIELPGELQKQIFRFMESLNLRSGAFDFILDERGEFVFLEVNSCGQWLWMEVNESLPILDAFAKFLISGDANYQYKVDQSPVVRYEDFLKSDRADQLYAGIDLGASSSQARTVEGRWFSSIVEFESGEK